MAKNEIEINEEIVEDELTMEDAPTTEGSPKKNLFQMQAKNKEHFESLSFSTDDAELFNAVRDVYFAKRGYNGTQYDIVDYQAFSDPKEHQSK